MQAQQRETRKGASFPVALMLYKLCFMVYIVYHIHRGQWLLILSAGITFIASLFAIGEARKAYRQSKKNFTIAWINYLILGIYIATLATLLYIISSTQDAERPLLLLAQALPFLLALLIYLFKDSSALHKS